MDANHDRSPAAAAADSPSYALSGKIMLISTVVLFSAVLFLFFIHLYLRSRFHLRRHLRRHLPFAVRSSSPGAADLRGLDAAVLKSLPVLIFPAAGEEEEEEPVECAVCLCEFEDGEKIRGLPRCGHRFHIECIDMWFHSHATCPLCRSPVETADDAAATSASLPAAAHRWAIAPEPSPPDPERPTPVIVVETPASSSGGREVRVEVQGRGWEGEIGMGLKSPGSRMLLLTRILSKDSRSCRGGVAAAEPDLERGDGAENGPGAAAQ